MMADYFRKSAAMLATMSFLLAGKAYGQKYDRIVDRNVWNLTSNVCGIRTDSVNVATAEIYGKYTRGNFRDPSDAPELWNAGAGASALRHWGRISMGGTFAFDDEEAVNGCGAMLSRAEGYPVNVYEFTPGRKSRQNYVLKGSAAIELTDYVTFGLFADVMNSNISKRKDLRYTSYLLNLRLGPSLLVRFDNGAAVGISYTFDRRAENMKAEELGVSSETYYGFIDKGLMYGSYDVWTGGALHLKEFGVNGTPIRLNSHSVALQGSYGGFVAELSGFYASGSAGEKDVQWFNFSGRGVDALAGWSDGIHRATLKFSASLKANNEDINEKVTDGGVTSTVNYGSRSIYSAAAYSLNPEYYYLGETFQIRSGLLFDWTASYSTLIYPYVGSLVDFVASAYVSGVYNIRGFDVGLGLGFRGGNMTDRLSSTADDVEVSEKPLRLDAGYGNWFSWQEEWRTAKAMSVSASLRYTFRFGLFLSGSASLTRGFSCRYVAGRHRADAGLSVGYVF